MNRYNLLSVTALLLTFSILTFAQKPETGSVRGESEVEQLVREYFAAWQSSNVEKMKRVLHPKAKLFLPTHNNTLVAQTPSQLYANFRSNDRHTRGVPPIEGALRITRTDVTGEAASVKLEVEYPTSNVVEHLSLMKFKDGWKIVSRVSSVKLEPARAKLD